MKSDSTVPSRLWHGLRLLVALALSGVSLALILRDVDWYKLASVLRQANLVLVWLAIATVVASFLSKAARWRMLFVENRLPTTSRAFSVLSIGLLINAIAPIRIGELARAYLMGESLSVSTTYVLGTLAIEKFAELATALLTVALLVTQMILPEWFIKPTQITILGIAAFVLVLLLVRKEQFVLRGARLAGRLVPHPRGEWLIAEAQQGLVSLRSVSKLSVLRGLLAWSLLAWAFGITTNYLVLLALGLALPIWAALLVLVVTQIGVAVIPSAPGQVGVFHYLAVLSLSIFSVEKEVALAYAVLLHLVVYAPMILVGSYCFWRERIAWQRLVRAAVRVRSRV